MEILWDHPRSRGEYRRDPLDPAAQRGSSPLSRGIQWPVGTNKAVKRIIPALAGNTSSAARPAPAARDHPRSRGEYQLERENRRINSGSSPLSRGIPNWRSIRLRWAGIIPALAGNTSMYGPNTRRTGDHPRSRGEYVPTGEAGFQGQGSSPLSRGIPGRHGLHRSGQGIIPALAGNTGCGRGFRAGGGGSSPLSRGIRGYRVGKDQRAGIIPALAGNTSAT